MSFRVTNTFTGQTTLDAAQLDKNFQDIEGKFNQGITSADLSPVAGITPQQLSNAQFSFVGSISMPTFNVTTGAPPYGPANVPAGMFGFPGPDAQLGDLEIFSTSFVLKNTGIAGGTVTLRGEIGNIDVAGQWNKIEDWFPSFLFTSTAAHDFASGIIPQSGDPVVVDMSQEPLFAAVFVTRVSGGAPIIINNVGDFVNVSFRVQRVGGLHQ
jgi:hypothetical protein